MRIQWLPCLIALTPAAAAQSAACNNQTRTAQVVAGYHNSLAANCPTLTISVAGQSFSTPAQCLQGYAYYQGTVYTCGPGASGIHCNPQGYRVSIDLCQGGGCPDITGLSAGSWESWADVPAAIQTALSCVTPSCTRTFDWSASTRACFSEPFPPGPGESHGTVHEGGSGETFVLCGQAGIGAVAAPDTTPLLSPYEAAQSASPEVLPPALRQAYLAYRPVHGVTVSADVSIEHFADDGTRTNHRSFHLVGTVLEDGRFDVVQMEPVLVDDEQQTATARLAFDGATLFVLDDAAEAGNAYTSTYGRLAEVFERSCMAIRPLFEWTRDPLRVPLFASADFQVEEQAELLHVRRLVPWAGEIRVSEEHQIAGGAQAGRPLEWRCVDQAGGLRGRLLFDEPRLLAAEVQRHGQVTDILYLDGGASQRRIVTRLRVSRAALAPEGALDEPPAFGDDVSFQVWR